MFGFRCGTELVATSNVDVFRFYILQPVVRIFRWPWIRKWYVDFAFVQKCPLCILDQKRLSSRDALDGMLQVPKNAVNGWSMLIVFRSDLFQQLIYLELENIGLVCRSNVCCA